MNPVIGLTGGIGSGKSTVADLFSHLGVTVVDTDRIAHELTGAEGAAMPEIIVRQAPATFRHWSIGSGNGENQRIARQVRPRSCPR